MSVDERQKQNKRADGNLTDMLLHKIRERKVKTLTKN